MKNLTMLLIFVFVFSLFGYAQKSPAGLVVVGSHCASGDYDYYFFSDKQVTAVWALGEEASLLTGGVAKGTWSINSKGETEITYDYMWEFVPAPNAQVVMVAAQTIYDSYEAKLNKNPKNLSTKMLVTIGEEGCSVTKKHNYSNANDFFISLLKAPNFKRQFAFTSEKVLSEKDLARYSKAELEIMRNELFAQYNHNFQNPKWKKYFTERGSLNFVSNSEVFFTDIEKKNLTTIRAVESKKR